MRVCQRQRRHLCESWREWLLVPPFTRAFLKSPSSRGLSAIAELLVICSRSANNLRSYFRLCAWKYYCLLIPAINTGDNFFSSAGRSIRISWWKCCLCVTVRVWRKRTLKPWKWGFGGKGSPFWKKIEILSWNNSLGCGFTFWVQISRESAAGKWVKRCAVSVVKSSQTAFFRRRFASVCQEGPKFCTGACHLGWHVPVKFCPNRFQFAGVMSNLVWS